MKRRKTLSIVAFLFCAAASIMLPLAVQAYWDHHSKDWSAQRRSEAATGVWVYGLGIDKILQPLSITDVETAIGDYPSIATNVMVVFPGDSRRAYYAPANLRSNSITPVHLPPGTEVLISHDFSTTAVLLIGLGLLTAMVSWVLFAVLGLIGVLRDVDGWRWRSCLIRVSTCAGAVYATLCLFAFIALRQ